MISNFHIKPDVCFGGFPDGFQLQIQVSSWISRFQMDFNCTSSLILDFQISRYYHLQIQVSECLSTSKSDFRLHHKVHSALIKNLLTFKICPISKLQGSNAINLKEPVLSIFWSIPKLAQRCFFPIFYMGGYKAITLTKECVIL